MGIHALIPELKERYPTHVYKQPPSPDRLRIVDLMGRLFMLTVSRKPAAGAAADAAPVRMTGAQAFAIIGSQIVDWLQQRTYDPVTGAVEPRRAIIITDKSDAVPLEKADEHKERAVQQDKAVEKARAAGTYQVFVGPVHMDDAGLVDTSTVRADAPGAPLRTRPFDPFSVINQRPARTALVTYLRRKFAEVRLPPHAELIVDLGYNQPDVHGHHHAHGGAGCHPGSDGVLVGHALCGGPALDEDYDVAETPAGAGAALGVAIPAPVTGEALTVAEVEDEIDAEMQHIALYGSSRTEPDDVPAAASAGAATAGPNVMARSAFRRPTDATGEAEVLAILYALQFACATPQPLTICIQSADSDVFAAACNAFWDAPGHCRLLWASKPDEVFDLTGIYAHMRNVERLTPERVLLACIGHGTDYVRKADLFFFMNTTVIWDAARAIRLPHDRGARAALCTGDDDSTAASESDASDAPPAAAATAHAPGAGSEDDEGRPAAPLRAPRPPRKRPSATPVEGDVEYAGTYRVGRCVRARRRRYIQTPEDAAAAVFTVYAHALTGAPAVPRAGTDVERSASALRATAITRGATRAQVETLYRVFKHHAKVKVPADTPEFRRACERLVFNLAYWHDEAALDLNPPQPLAQQLA